MTICWANWQLSGLPYVMHYVPSMVTFLIPASAILLGVIFLGETLALNHVMGLALIFCGLLLVDGQVPRFFLRKRTSRT